MTDEIDEVDEAKKKAAIMLTAEVSVAELAVRMAESISGRYRPKGMGADEALHVLVPTARDTLLECANVAILYWKECLEKAQSCH